MKKLIFGILLSSALVYFSLRGIDYEKIFEGLKNVRYVYLVPAAVLIFLIVVLRSLRWAIILSPLRKISQKQLFPITSVGFMSIIFIPMRIGELMRPYLLSSKGLVPFSSSLATILVERVFDALTVLGLFLLVLLFSPLPSWLTKSGYMVMASFGLILFFIWFLYFKTQLFLRLLSPLLKSLPQGFHRRVEGLILNFVAGLRISASPMRLLGIFILTLLIWISAGLSIYSLFFFHRFQLSLFAAFFVLVVNLIGISLPTAPGMLGNFQYSCIMALSVFNLPKSEAFAFSMVYYFLGMGITILLGLVSLPFVDISVKKTLKDIKGSIISGQPAEDRIK